MENSKKRPRANPEPPLIDGEKELLQKLLDIEIERLDVAVRIEKERNIVFPETTVIIRDILKLKNAIANKEKNDESKKDDEINMDLDDFNIDIPDPFTL